MTPYFSIIIPTLNEAKYLPKLLTCLQRQTMRDFEVIVVDAQSPDETLAKANQFTAKLPSLLLLTTPQRNVSFQRNLGAKKAHGRIFLFMDADTQIPLFYLDGIKYKLSKTRPDIFTTWLKADTNNTQDKAIAVIINLGFEAGRFLDKPNGMGAMLGVTKKAFLQLKGFTPIIHYAEDQEFIRRAVEHNLKFAIFRDPAYTYSFRRFRKEGTLGNLRQFAKLQTQLLQNGYFKSQPADYPMGGHHFTQFPPSFWDKLNYSLKKIFPG